MVETLVRANGTMVLDQVTLVVVEVSSQKVRHADRLLKGSITTSTTTCSSKEMGLYQLNIR
jgi:hypothetical protein